MFQCPRSHQGTVKCSNFWNKNMNATFLNDEAGAVTVDWVVLTAALVGLGLAVMGVVSGGIEDLSTDVSAALEDESKFSEQFGGITLASASNTTVFSGRTASDYVAYGQSLAPGNNGAVYYHAQQAAISDAPDGYNFDNPLSDPDSGNVIYTSNDGQNYSIGGNVVSVDSYAGSANYFGA